MGQKPGTRPGWYPKIAGIYGRFLRFLSPDDAGMGQNQLGASAVEPGDPVGGGGGIYGPDIHVSPEFLWVI
jgi:hypothetical protein